MDDGIQSCALTFLQGFKIEDPNFYPPSTFAKQAVSQFTALKWWQTLATSNKIMQDKNQMNLKLDSHSMQVALKKISMF